jgi:hypothetical protein
VIITVNRKKFVNAIKQSLTFKNGSQDVQNCIKIETLQDVVKISGWKVEIIHGESIYKKLFITIDAIIEESGIIIYNKKMLLELIKNESEKELHLNISNDGYRLNNYQLNPSEFPDIETIEKEKIFFKSIASESMKSIINYIDKNLEMIKYADDTLKCIHFKFNENNLELATTDSHMLVVDRFQMDNEKNIGFSINDDVLNFLLKNWKNNDVTINVYLEEEYDAKLLSGETTKRFKYAVELCFGDYKYRFLSPFTYPNYENVYPNVNTKFTFNKEKFINAIQRFKDLNNSSNNGIVFYFNLGKEKVGIEIVNLKMDKVYSKFTETEKWKFSGSCIDETDKYSKKIIRYYNKYSNYVGTDFMIEVESGGISKKEFLTENGVLRYSTDNLGQWENIKRVENFDCAKHIVSYNIDLLLKGLKNIDSEIFEFGYNYEILEGYKDDKEYFFVEISAVQLIDAANKEKIILVMGLEINR